MDYPGQPIERRLSLKLGDYNGREEMMADLCKRLEMDDEGC